MLPPHARRGVLLKANGKGRQAVCRPFLLATRRRNPALAVSPPARVCFAASHPIAVPMPDEPPPTGATPPAPKRGNLALQGGGAHGAFTWGVLDRLLEDPRPEFEGVSGSSAGAINGAVMAQGLMQGGPAASAASSTPIGASCARCSTAAARPPAPGWRITSTTSARPPRLTCASAICSAAPACFGIEASVVPVAQLDRARDS